jgi:hypothetical protein
MTTSDKQAKGAPISLAPLFSMMDHQDRVTQNARQTRQQHGCVSAIDRHMQSESSFGKMTGTRRIQLCRSALEALDRCGWDRSFHQRLFHEVACAFLIKRILRLSVSVCRRNT